MNYIYNILQFITCFFAITFTIYYFNLDSKLFQALYDPMMNYFENMERDRKI